MSISVYMLFQIWFFYSVKCMQDPNLTVPEKIKDHGYPCQNISIETADGYILTLFRIPYGKNETFYSTRPAVFLMHGLFGSSQDYVAMGPEKGLGYILADRGYDVWLGNARGTPYSRKHSNLNTKFHSTSYWDFSWHEIGVYDLPAAINCIKNMTKQSQISYIGMSQGTTVSYVLGSEKSQYNNDLSVVISLAPVAFMGHVKSHLVLLISKFEKIIQLIAKIININELPPKPISKLLDSVIKVICKEDSSLVDVCANFLYIVGGYSTQFDKEILLSIIGTGISPISLRQGLHYMQNIKSGEFRQYNFGELKNLKVYGTVTPPNYNLSKITAPVALFYSKGDWLAQPQDVDKLYETLPNCVYKHEVELDTFNHFDFIFARDIVPLLFDDVFRVLDKYSNNNLIDI